MGKPSRWSLSIKKTQHREPNGAEGLYLSALFLFLTFRILELYLIERGPAPRLFSESVHRDTGAVRLCAPKGLSLDLP